MSLPELLLGRLRLPVIAAPMFIVSNPELAIAQSAAGIVGSFPTLNARPIAELDRWLGEMRDRLAAWDRANPDRPAAPFAVNLIVHRSNPRLEDDLALVVRHRVPIVITSLGAREDVNRAVRAYGGITLHDVTTPAFARKAIDKGASGLILVAAGAGGHAGTLSPFALVQEVRAWFDGPVILSGAIANGRSILAAQAMGADLAYVGSAFIATGEANASAAYKQAVVEGRATDIVYSSFFTGVHGNYLRGSIAAAGYDPDRLAEPEPGTLDVAAGAAKAWRDIWGAGQGIGAIDRVVPAQALIARLAAEYAEARAELAALPA